MASASLLKRAFIRVGLRPAGPGAPAAGMDPMAAALALSLGVHAVLLLLIGFELPPPHLPYMSQPLEVVLVNSRTRSRPHKADVLAQANLDGGGNTEQDLRAKTNMPAQDDPQDDEIALAARRQHQLEEEVQRMMAQLAAQGVATEHTTRARAQQDPSNDPKLANLPDQKLRLARLQAQIEREWQAYQRLPKRHFVGSRAESVPYAEYVDEWRQRIERVGTAHFPDEARRQGLFGSVLVTVAVRADGSVEAVVLERSSGNPVLDAAVTQIVRLAAPFRAFPPLVRKETDVLHITRNWSFTRSDLQVTGP